MALHIPCSRSAVDQARICTEQICNPGMDVDPLSAYPSPPIQVLYGVWTASVTLLPAEAPVRNGSGVGALGVSGQLTGFTKVVVI